MYYLRLRPGDCLAKHGVRFGTKDAELNWVYIKITFRSSVSQFRFRSSISCSVAIVSTKYYITTKAICKKDFAASCRCHGRHSWNYGRFWFRSLGFEMDCSRDHVLAFIQTVSVYVHGGAYRSKSLPSFRLAFVFKVTSNAFYHVAPFPAESLRVN